MVEARVGDCPAEQEPGTRKSLRQTGQPEPRGWRAWRVVAR